MMTDITTATAHSKPATIALWNNPFRPFYLLGALYGLLYMTYWLSSYTGLLQGWMPPYPIHLYHGHEMIFGFAAAIISGFVLTALGSWAGIEELSGSKLIILVTLWLGGRLVTLLAAQLPPLLVTTVDSSLFLVMGAMIAPGLFRARNKVYLTLLLIFAGLFGGNLMFHLGTTLAGNGDLGLANQGLYLGIYAIIFKFSIVGGYLSPIFTNNVLKQRKIAEITFHPLIETLAVVTVLAFIATDLLGLGSTWCGTAALLTTAVHGLRVARWRSTKITDVPVIWVMHLAYGWMVFAFGLRALSDFSDLIPANSWLHAFTVGAMGLMMMGLMTRVVLRHTGRPVKPAKVLVFAYGLIFMAGLARVSVSLFDTGLVVLSAALWMIPFAVYLKLHGMMLIRPSLPKKK